MFRSLRQSRKVGGLHLLVVLTMLLALFPTYIVDVAAADNTPTVGKSEKLPKTDQDILAGAKASGKSTIKVLIASNKGSNQAVADKVKSLGGVIQYQKNRLDYLRVEVAVDKVKALAALSEVQALEVERDIQIDDPKPDGAGPVNPQTPPGKTTPQNNPYMPINDIGAVKFMKDHPVFDGRDVVVGIVDSGVDLAHPALQETTTGQRKILDWVTATNPISDNDPTWVKMTDTVVSSGFHFTYQGHSYRVPLGEEEDGATYRIGIFNERDPRLGGEVGSDVNRDGNPAGSNGLFTVIWRSIPEEDYDAVWVDANQNYNFTDDKLMMEYKKFFDVSYFGKDNPATPIVERMPFVIQIDKANNYVNIGIPSGEHGTHVGGIVAANKMFGGKMTGVAPGAQLVSVRVCLFISGCTNFALLEGMIYAVETAKVNVINMSIGGLPALNDGNNTRAELYNRLIREFNVQMFISAGNDGAGINTVGDPGLVTDVMSVGTYITKATWQADYGSDSAYVDNQHGFSSRGPREDGGFKPDIIAPGAAVSTTPTWEDGGPVVGTYNLPPGYSMLQGTSMASPQAAGAAALLLSAAYNDNFQDFVTAPLLRKAMRSTARFIDPTRYQAKDQGNGLINIPAAWDLLVQELEQVDITSSVPVSTVLSGFLATPGVGVGIYDREGVTKGTNYSRTYTFKRTSGDAGNQTFKLKWVGNDGTFSSQSSVVLPLNVATTVVVSINTANTGVHSAILRLDDESMPGIEYQTMNTVVVPEVFTTANNGTVTKTGSIGRNQVTSYFFKVPAGTPAFKVDLSSPNPGGFDAAGNGQVRFLRFHPYGVAIDTNSSLSCYTPSAGSCVGDPLSRTLTNPFAGVWEVVVEARRTSDAVTAPYTLTASILGATVTPNPDVIATAKVGVPIARSYTLTNLFGAFTGRAVGSSLGSARRGVFNIANLAQQQYVTVITPGTTSFRATIGGASDPAADLDLFVYNCTTGNCILVGQSAGGTSEESVTINNPAAGTWVVLIDGYAVPSGATNYNYIDVFSNPAFGAIAITDANALRPAGASWTVPATVTAGAVPATGRILYGTVQVRTDTNILIGQGEVIVQSVTP